MTDLMNASTQSHHYPPHPNDVVGNRRPARPSSAQQRSTTPTRNRPQPNTSTSGLNTTAKLEQSILRHELDRTTASANSQKLNAKGKNRLYSTWTPLQDDETNAKLFEERRLLVDKWFEKWSDEQRRIIIEDLMGLSRPRQLTYTRNILSKRFPSYHQDFTRTFPRVICLYIFSFLDPRSLCRCAQVCWYWKFLSESDQIWMPKCLRFGWTPKQNPSLYETNVWKRVYTSNIELLQTMPIRDHSFRSHNTPYPYDDQPSARQITTRSNSTRYQNNHPHLSTSTHSRLEHPPWRANSRNPTDTLRFNVLDNDDTFLESIIAKHRKYPGNSIQNTESDHEMKHTSIERQTRSRTTDQYDHTGRKRRSQSLSARGSPSVSFRDESSSRHAHNKHNSFVVRPPSASGTVNRPADIPRPPSSAQKNKFSSKSSTNEPSNRTWHAANYEYNIDE